MRFYVEKSAVLSPLLFRALVLSSSSTSYFDFSGVGTPDKVVREKIIAGRN